MYLDPYEDYPEDDDRETDNPEVSIEIATKLKALGNTKFKNGELEAALEKWQSKPSFYPYFILFFFEKNFGNKTSFTNL